MIRRVINQHVINYIYSNNGLLSRIEYPDSSFDEIKYIGENAFIIRKNRNEEFGQIIEKRQYTKGRLRKIQYYRIQDKSDIKTGESTLSSEFDIEYYDEK